MLLDIVILPPKGLSARVGKFALKQSERLPTLMTVDNKKLFPHMSLFHLNMNKRKLPRLEAEIKQIAGRHKPFVEKSDGLNFVPKYFGIQLSRPSAAIRLNRDVVKSCYRLRDGIMPWTSSRKPTKIEARNRKRYGTQHNIRKTFTPHFTLGVFSRNLDKKVLENQTAKLDFKFLADTIAITEVNRWHQVTRVIKKFKLGQ